MTDSLSEMLTVARSGKLYLAKEGIAWESCLVRYKEIDSLEGAKTSSASDYSDKRASTDSIHHNSRDSE
jgi:hypothetical protein